MGPELELLLESCKSEHTKKQYVFCIKKYFDFLGNGNGNGNGNFKLPKDTKEIEDKIRDYIIFLEKRFLKFAQVDQKRVLHLFSGKSKMGFRGTLMRCHLFY